MVTIKMVRYSKEDVLNEEERIRLINSCKNDKERLVIIGLLNSGMRAGEFSHLKESWIDWQREVIHIPSQDKCERSCCSPKGMWKPKTRTGRRTIPMRFELKRILYDYFQKKKRIEMSRVTIFRVVKKVGRRLRPFKKVYPHSLRATFASMLAEKGMGASDIQMILGWSKLETANNYVRSTQSIQNFRDKFK